jgi:hypothetical protein
VRRNDQPKLRINWSDHYPAGATELQINFEFRDTLAISSQPIPGSTLWVLIV